MNDLTFKKVLSIEPKFVLEVAMGLREPVEIAEDYGFSAEQWLALKVHEPFVKQVDEKKAELKESGWTFKMKSAVIAEELLESLYVKATDEDATLHAVLESLKFVSKAAGLDQPKQDAAAAGSGFSINITIGGQSVQISGAQKGRILDADEEDESLSPRWSGGMDEDYDFTQSFGAYEPVALPV